MLMSYENQAVYEIDNNNKINGGNIGLTSCSSFVPVLILLYLLTVHVERERQMDRQTALVESFQL